MIPARPLLVALRGAFPSMICVLSLDDDDDDEFLVVWLCDRRHDVFDRYKVHPDDPRTGEELAAAIRDMRVRAALGG